MIMEKASSSTSLDWSREQRKCCASPLAFQHGAKTVLATVHVWDPQV